MFSSENLYQIFKPFQNENLITKYDVVIGGTNLTADLNKGCIILTPISSVPLTSSYKTYAHLNRIEDLDLYEIKEDSFIKNTYQIDIYKINKANIKGIEVEGEAYKIREWLKSYYVEDYLKAFNSEILPCYDLIAFSSDLYNNKFANRANFSFEIVTRAGVTENTDYVTKIRLDNMLYLDNSAKEDLAGDNTEYLKKE